MVDLEQGLREMGVDVATPEGMKTLKLFIKQINDKNNRKQEALDTHIKATPSNRSNQDHATAVESESESEEEEALSEFPTQVDKFVENTDTKTSKFIQAPDTASHHKKSLGTIILKSEDGVSFAVYKTDLCHHSHTFQDRIIDDKRRSPLDRFFDVKIDERTLRIVVDWLHHDVLPKQHLLDSETLVKIGIVANTIQTPKLHNLVAEILFRRQDDLQSVFRDPYDEEAMDKFDISETTLSKVFRFGCQGVKLKTLVSEMLRRADRKWEEPWGEWKHDVIKYLGDAERTLGGDLRSESLLVEDTFWMRWNAAWPLP